MEHKNEIAIKLLRHEYTDYDDNSWHYDREYKMLVEAQNLALTKESDVRTVNDKCHIQNVSNNEERVTVSCSSCKWMQAKYDYKCDGCTQFQNYEQDTDC